MCVTFCDNLVIFELGCVDIKAVHVILQPPHPTFVVLACRQGII